MYAVRKEHINGTHRACFLGYEGSLNLVLQLSCFSYTKYILLLQAHSQLVFQFAFAKPLLLNQQHNSCIGRSRMTKHMRSMFDSS